MDSFLEYILDSVFVFKVFLFQMFWFAQAGLIFVVQIMERVNMYSVLTGLPMPGI